MLILVVLAFVLGVTLVVGLSLGASHLPGLMMQRKLDRRIDEVIGVASAEEEADGDQSLVKNQKTPGAIAALDRMLAGSTRGNALGRWIAQSGVKASVGTVLFIAAFSGVSVALLLGTAAGKWGMLAGGVLGFLIPFGVLRMKRRRRLHSFEENFPEALDLISRALKAGHAFATGLKMVADEMPEPIGPEFRKTFDEQNFGLPLKDALDNLSLRIPSLDVRFFATAVLIQRETGGNLSEILENLAHVVRERFKILRQVRVYTAHGRFTGYVLLGLPAFLGVALMFINPDHMNLLFRERLGQQMLMAGLLMQVVGFIWIQKVIKIEV
jgi:tight adherence protein B